MLSLALISFCIFTTYLGAMIWLFGIPTSLSNTFYLLKGKKEGLGGLFTLMMFSVAFTMFPVLIEITPSNIQFISFFIPLGLGFVGAAPHFKADDSLIHFSAAGWSTIFSLLWMLLVVPSFLGSIIFLSILGALLTLITSTRKCWLFWVEMVLMFSMFGAILDILIIHA